MTIKLVILNHESIDELDSIDRYLPATTVHFQLTGLNKMLYLKYCNFIDGDFFSIFGYLGDCFGADIFLRQPVYWCWLLLRSKSNHETVTRSKSSCKTDNKRCFNKQILNRDGYSKWMGLTVVSTKLFHTIY